jgi:DNA-binding transcriptional ArsR family regulator
MKDGPDIARLGALIGDPARANILAALMAGRALTAGECAAEAGVSAQTASGHLAQLAEARLLLVEAQGRHRYHRIAGPEVAEAIEALMGLAARVGLRRTRPGPGDAALRHARTCYDHLAGAVATAFYARLAENGLIAASPEGIALTAAGRGRFMAEGIDLADLEARPRPLCRACLDWSERRPHLAGALGTALLRHAEARGWCRRQAGSRAVIFAPGGEARLLALASNIGDLDSRRASRPSRV